MVRQGRNFLLALSGYQQVLFFQTGHNNYCCTNLHTTPIRYQPYHTIQIHWAQMILQELHHKSHLCFHCCKENFPASNYILHCLNLPAHCPRYKYYLQHRPLLHIPTLLLLATVSWPICNKPLHHPN